MDDDLNRWLDAAFDDLMKALEEQERLAGSWPDLEPLPEAD